MEFVSPGDRGHWSPEVPGLEDMSVLHQFVRFTNGVFDGLWYKVGPPFDS